MIDDVLIQNIKELAKGDNLTLKELAEKIGITEQGLHAMFRNKSFKLETLEKIANAFNVSVSTLFDEGEQDEYWQIVEELENVKLQIRKMALRGKGIIDIEFGIGNNKINLDFAELKQSVPLSYYEESDRIFKKMK